MKVLVDTNVVLDVLLICALYVFAQINSIRSIAIKTTQLHITLEVFN